HELVGRSQGRLDSWAPPAEIALPESARLGFIAATIAERLSGFEAHLEERRRQSEWLGGRPAPRSTANPPPPFPATRTPPPLSRSPYVRGLATRPRRNERRDMRISSNRPLLAAAAVVLVAAIAAIAGTALAGSKDAKSANGLGQLTGLLPRDNLTEESAIQVD